jgi:hypothetical protein
MATWTYVGMLALACILASVILANGRTALREADDSVR